MPPGPNPHRDDPIQVKPFGKIWAVVECLGVISAHRERAEAEAALKVQLDRRAEIRRRSPVVSQFEN
jgi:hypothetical protein